MSRPAAKRFLSIFLVVCLTNFGLMQSAGAVAIDTQTILQLQDREAAVSRIQTQLAREDVRRALIEMGVDPVQAQQRVATLTDAEVAQLDREMAKLPAAGDGGWILLVILLTVVIVLLATGKIRYNP